MNRWLPFRGCSQPFRHVFPVLSSFAHRTDSSAGPRQHRMAGTLCLHPRSNPAPNNVVDKYLLNETSFQSHSQALSFHRREGERKKTGKQDLLEQPEGKDRRGNRTGDIPSAPSRVLPGPEAGQGQLAPGNRIQAMSSTQRHRGNDSAPRQPGSLPEGEWSD